MLLIIILKSELLISNAFTIALATSPTYIVENFVLNSLDLLNKYLI